MNWSSRVQHVVKKSRLSTWNRIVNQSMIVSAYTKLQRECRLRIRELHNRICHSPCHPVSNHLTLCVIQLDERRRRKQVQELGRE